MWTYLGLNNQHVFGLDLGLRLGLADNLHDHVGGQQELVEFEKKNCGGGRWTVVRLHDDQIQREEKRRE